ncbi:tRNA (adenosine(37)-N6)-dimethylallyltransferase MiaA [uncultured Secundilactobacillus sp.]|uniref:tRNA (adenosine(37)-N6)-dimethylallyltransferase MiaA n=1 Tax=uncultured Secundilactobacillus sp. TaxID=2813935 RepID=UPI00258671AC|nr:tRNA (adenosine(37)-N6)-dimethylallyltransferase MiaA [uncultured Secundilactobacillus sp.]
MEKVLAILGPTAVGKTKLSIELAKRFNGEIISGDSMQVYRGLDIGTAKITPSEMAGVTHHLIDIKDVTARYSVAEFVTRAQQLITEITARGHLPMVVGGTGFYAKALLYEMNLGGDHYDERETVRNKWRDFLAANGQHALWLTLASVDSVAADRIPETNTRRVIRALEVYETTGVRFSAQQSELTPRYDAMVIGLNTARDQLYDRINQRVDEMMTAGLIDEAKWLLAAQGFDHQAGKGIGYREFEAYFSGEQSLDDVAATIKLDTRHYAKRQLTWLRHQLPVTWYDLVQYPAELTKIMVAVQDWLAID